ncbi:hypothetical protein K7X08_017789 [Anisodus acutangulus]|uniref:C2H2-type domain-containing protein n=1 Tax=Anisodus acutangulus TaxID=402998 RepID=A0A9Q1R9W5_9SOLA|nr:hypothetical protein K7X08_017789 [Anisodus acutangulus]
MEQQNGRGRVIYQCMNCNLLCNSSQSLAAHTKGHIIKDGWVKGTRQRKIFVPYDENNQVQQQQQVAPEIDEQQVAPEIADTTNVHQAAAQNAQNPPSSPARQRPLAREIHLGPRRSPVRSRPILNPTLARAMMQVPPPPPPGRMPKLQGMMHANHWYPCGRIPYIDNQPQHQQVMVHVPHFAAPAPVAPRLIQVGTLQVGRRVNQLVPNGFRRDLYAAYAAWRADHPTQLSTGSNGTVTVTADPMSGKKNEDKEVEELDLELRL